MNINDIIILWDWVQKRLSRTFEPPKETQPKATLNLPCPKLDSVIYYPTTKVGEPLPIIISATNKGEMAFSGGITISFPDVIHNGDGAYIQVESTPSENRKIYLFDKNSSNNLTSTDNSIIEKIPPQYLMRELEVNSWSKNEDIDFKLKVTPTKEGILRFYVTVWMATDNWEQIIRTPIIKDVTDQQNHAVYPFVVKVMFRK